MSHTEKYFFTESMGRYGGHFCQLLAAAMRRADSSNFSRIVDAFPELVAEYGPGSRFYDSIAG